MKRIFMSAVALLLVTAAVQAQTDSTNGPRREWRQGGPHDPYQQLNLTADQQAKVQALRESFRKQADDLRAQNLSDDDRRTKMQALREQQRQQIDGILTPDQKTQLDKLRSERREQMGNQRNGDSTGRGNRQSFNPRNLQKELNLTSDQQAKLKEIRSSFKSKADALRNDQTLTADQRRTKFHELMQQQEEQMKTMLTQEQLEKWQQRHKRNSNRDKDAES